jgi:hypothetical protein
MAVTVRSEQTATTSPETTLSRETVGLSRVAALLESNVFLICVVAACVAARDYVGRAFVASDSWYTVLGGRLIVDSGLPHKDTLTLLTLGRNWVDQQWLAQLAFYGLWVAGNWQLAMFVVTVLSVGAFGIAAATGRKLGASDRNTAIVLTFAFVVGASNTVLRAQILAYPLFAVVLALLLLDARRPSRRVYLVFPLLVLWANIHGSVVVGAGLVALRGVTAAWPSLRDRHFDRPAVSHAAALAVLPWICILVSPYGPSLPHYYESVLGSSGISQYVSEWQPTSVTTTPFFFLLLLPALWLMGRARGALSGFAQLALLITAILGLEALRNDIWFAITAAAVLPVALEAVWPASKAPRRARTNLRLAIVGIAATVLMALVVAVHGASWYERDFPKQAATAVAAAAQKNPSLKVYSNETYSDWLIFDHPALAGRVAYDIRFELLSAKQLNALARFRTQSGVGWQNAANGYGLLVLDPDGDSGSIAYYRRQPGTKVLYRDKHVVVLQRPVS